MQKDKKYPEYSGNGNANWKGGKTGCQCELCGKTFYAYINKTEIIVNEPEKFYG